MFGIIYKITCLTTNKVYIGQTTRNMKARFDRHINEALKNTDSPYHIQRAIRKYGKDNFIVEEIDQAENQIELNEKEKYWITTYNSIIDGYNEATGGQGGNTYAGLTIEELNLVKQKISIANSGKNNGQSKQIKCKSIKTNAEYFFETVSDCLKFLGIKNKAVVMDRVNKKVNTLWRHEWLFAFENDEYQNYIDFIYDPSCRKGTKVELVSENETLVFNSKNKALEYLGLPKGSLVNNAIIKNYLIRFL